MAVQRLLNELFTNLLTVQIITKRLSIININFVKASGGKKT